MPWLSGPRWTRARSLRVRSRVGHMARHTRVADPVSMCKHRSMNSAAQNLSEQLRDDYISPKGANWSPWPGGWRGEISTALIDAIYSARAVYKTKNQSGIHAQVSGWRIRTGNRRDSLPSLIDDINAAGARQWAESFGNSQHSPGRSRQRPERPWKSATVLEAAESLTNEGIHTARDIDDTTRDQAETLLRNVPGIGQATSTYFLMLLGFRGVKADVMIRRYVGHAISNGSAATTKAATEAVTAVADSQGWPILDLEHSIWTFERNRQKANLT